MLATRTQFTVAGDVSSFDAASFRRGLLAHFTAGANAGSGVTDVAVSVRPGSVLVDVTILSQTDTAADMVQAELTTTPAAAMSATWFGGAVSVATVSAPTTTTEVVNAPSPPPAPPPSPPPPSPPPPSPPWFLITAGTVQAITGADDGGISDATEAPAAWAVLLVIMSVLALLAVGVLCFVRYLRPRMRDGAKVHPDSRYTPSDTPAAQLQGAPPVRVDMEATPTRHTMRAPQFEVECSPVQEMDTLPMGGGMRTPLPPITRPRMVDSSMQTPTMVDSDMQTGELVGLASAEGRENEAAEAALLEQQAKAERDEAALREQQAKAEREMDELQEKFERKKLEAENFKAAAEATKAASPAVKRAQSEIPTPLARAPSAVAASPPVKVVISLDAAAIAERPAPEAAAHARTATTANMKAHVEAVIETAEEAVETVALVAERAPEATEVEPVAGPSSAEAGSQDTVVELMAMAPVAAAPVAATPATAPPVAPSPAALVATAPYSATPAVIEGAAPPAALAAPPAAQSAAPTAAPPAIGDVVTEMASTEMATPEAAAKQTLETPVLIADRMPPMPARPRSADDVRRAAKREKAIQLAARQQQQDDINRALNGGSMASFGRRTPSPRGRTPSPPASGRGSSIERAAMPVIMTSGPASAAPGPASAAPGAATCFAPVVSWREAPEDGGAKDSK